MFEIQNYANFVAAIVVFQMIPGPGTLKILDATARGGIAIGMGAVLGTLLGDLIYMIAAIAGLAAFMQANPIWFQGLQWFGVIYLGWMGFGLLRSPVDSIQAAKAVHVSAAVHFRQSLAITLTNPKAILFFVAFFPLFMRPNASPATLAAMAAHVSIIGLFYQTGLVLVGNAIARKLSSMPFLRALTVRLAGVALLGFGARLAFNTR